MFLKNLRAMTAARCRVHIVEFKITRIKENELPYLLVSCDHKSIMSVTVSASGGLFYLCWTSLLYVG